MAFHLNGQGNMIALKNRYDPTATPEQSVTADQMSALKNRYGWKYNVIIQALVDIKRNAKHRANCKKNDYDLSLRLLVTLYLDQDGKCCYTGRTMELFRDVERQSQRTSKIISLDRKDPAKGYVAGNVQLCCCDVNIAKADFSSQEFLEMCIAVAAMHELHMEASL
jgi:hypothetical protein